MILSSWTCRMCTKVFQSHFSKKMQSVIFIWVRFSNFLKSPRDWQDHTCNILGQICHANVNTHARGLWRLITWELCHVTINTRAGGIDACSRESYFTQTSTRIWRMGKHETRENNQPQLRKWTVFEASGMAVYNLLSGFPVVMNRSEAFCLEKKKKTPLHTTPMLFLIQCQRQDELPKKKNNLPVCLFKTYWYNNSVFIIRSCICHSFKKSKLPIDE